MDDHDDIRKICRKRLAERRKISADDRDTLLPCPACDGQGSKIEGAGTGYKMKSCGWCDGAGHTDRFMIQMYREYERSGLL